MSYMQELHTFHKQTLLYVIHRRAEQCSLFQERMDRYIHPQVLYLYINNNIIKLINPSWTLIK